MYEQNFFSFSFIYLLYSVCTIEQNIAVHTYTRLIKYFPNSRAYVQQGEWNRYALAVAMVMVVVIAKTQNQIVVIVSSKNLAIMLTEKRAMSNYINQADYLHCAQVKCVLELLEFCPYFGPYSMFDNMHAFAIWDRTHKSESMRWKWSEVVWSGAEKTDECREGPRWNLVSKFRVHFCLYLFGFSFSQSLKWGIVNGRCLFVKFTDSRWCDLVVLFAI